MIYRDTNTIKSDRDAIIDERKKILAEFIGCNPNKITFNSWCNDNDLYEYMGKFYHCASLRNHTYGDEWYPKNQWRDIEGHRCAIEYYIVRNEQENTWTLYIGGKEIYKWKNRTTNYEKKTARQIRQIALSYVNELIKNCEDDYNPKVVFATIENHFWHLFGRWFDGRNCKLEMNLEGN